MRSEADRLGMSWAYWDFATDFGAFDLGGTPGGRPSDRRCSADYQRW